MSSQLPLEPSLKASAISSYSVVDIVSCVSAPCVSVVMRFKESEEYVRNEDMSSSPENERESENGEFGCDGEDSE